MSKKNLKDVEYKAAKMDSGYYSAQPLPNKEMLSEFYSQVYYQESASTTYQSTYTDDELKQKKLRADLLLHTISQVSDLEKGAFLEVGCGEGFLLNSALNKGLDVEGIDFSIHGINSFHPELTDRVHTGDAFDILERFIADGKTVDFCVLQNILEHVIEPVKLINSVKAILSDKGVLVITVPNDYSGMQNRVMELGFSDREYWFLPPQHLHYFNIDTLNIFVKENGFEVLDSFGDFPIEMFLFHEGSNYVHNPINGKGAHRARITLDLLLSENGLQSYHLFCQAMTACGIGRNVTLLLRPNANSD